MDRLENELQQYDLAAPPIQPAPMRNISPKFDQLVRNEGQEQLPAAALHQPAHQVGGNLPPIPDRHALPDPFAGLHPPNPVPSGLPELRPGPPLDFAAVHHLRPGLIPGLSHRQREGLTQTLIGQRQNRINRYMVIDAAEDELDALRYEAHLLREMAARDDEIEHARWREELEKDLQRWQDEQDEKDEEER
ncbi:hypothetical protein E8E11_002547 [Didymella keratinophila]|nr:hypothetical protein E8E11_002547 [Didymella keratinophila]